MFFATYSLSASSLNPCEITRTSCTIEFSRNLYTPGDTTAPSTSTEIRSALSEAVVRIFPAFSKLRSLEPEESDKPIKPYTKNINLAAKLNDGAKIYIPKIEEGDPQEITDMKTSLININTASSETLDTLPGIGPATAAKIISNRPYKSLEELLDKKVVSLKVFEQIKDKITVY